MRRAGNHQLPADLRFRQAYDAEPHLLGLGDGFGNERNAETLCDQLDQRSEIAYLEGDAPLHVRLGKAPVDQLACAPIRLEIDEGFVAEGGELHVLMAR